MNIAKALAGNLWSGFRRILLHRPLAVSSCLHLAAVAGAVALVAGLPRLEAMLATTVLLAVLGAVSFTKLRFVLVAKRAESQALHRRIRDFETKRELSAIELEATKETYKEAINNLIVANEVALQNLMRSNRELDDFAYIASHDLKEPLRGIHNYANFLIEDYREKLGDEGRTKLERLASLAQRLEALIDSLLHYSRIGRTELAISDTSLAEVLEGVTETLHVSLEENAVTLRVPRPLPTLRCDAARIGEVFLNLITNAIKYNTSPTKWIEIGYHTREEIERENLSIDLTFEESMAFYVKDNGIGIREKHYDAIFRIFKRLHGREKFQGGTGAGLTIVKKIVERHGGRVWVSSVLGEGTTFYFTLEGSERNEPSHEQFATADSAG